MTLRLVVGPPGSGKTHRCILEAAQRAASDPDGAPVLFLAPEQATFQAEQALLDHPGGGRVRVHSFSRLANWVHSLRPAPFLPPVTDVHREVIAAAVVARMRHDPAAPPIFRVNRIDRAIAALAAELKGQRLDAADLRRAAAEAAPRDPVLARKLEQLAVAAQAHDDAVAGHFQDPELALASLRDELARLPELQGAHATLDAYHTLTPVEREVLAGLLARCARVTLAITMDGERLHALLRGEAPRPGTRGWAQEDFAQQVLAVARDAGVDVEPPLLLPESGASPRFAAPALGFLARRFLDRASVESLPGAHDEVRLLEAPDPRGEARAAVRQLLEWRARGWRWRDMAILARDLEPHALALEEALRALRIPHFLDRLEPLDTHPLIQGTVAALEAVLGAWRQDALLAFAKSGLLLELDAVAVARLEDFTARHPRTINQWRDAEPWKAPPSRSPFEDGDEDPRSPWDMQALDATRRAIVEPLDAFAAALLASGADAPAITLRAAALAICALWAQARPQPSEDDLAVLREGASLLAAMAEAGGVDEFSPPMVLDLVRETLGRLALPRIPPSLDEVLVGAADRSRVPPVRGVVVIGTAEGEFPASGSNRTLLTDSERDALLERHGVELRSSGRRLFLREPFLAWMALTRASDALVVTRPLRTSQGDAASPSPWWAELRRRLPGVQPAATGDELSWESALSAREAAAVACRELLGAHLPGAPARAMKLRPFADQLHPDARAAFERVLRDADDRNAARLDPALVREFFGEHWRTSASALEAFASCPFQYFSRVMLRPDVPLDGDVTAADLGSLAHATLKALADNDAAFLAGAIEASDDDIKSRVAAAFAKPRERLVRAGILANKSSQLAADHLLEALVVVVGKLRGLGEKLGCEIIATEVQFGGDDTALVFGGEWPVHVRGQVDRVDRTREGLVVLDYKSSPRTFNWAKARAGAALQLQVYLLAARELLDGEPIGAFFAPISARDEKSLRPRGVVAVEPLLALAQDFKDLDPFLVVKAKAATETQSMGDALTAVQLAALLDRAAQSIAAHAAAVASGAVAPHPIVLNKQPACEHCDHRPACRLEVAFNGQRRIPGGKRDAIINEWLGPAQGAAGTEAGA